MRREEGREEGRKEGEGREGGGEEEEIQMVYIVCTSSQDAVYELMSPSRHGVSLSLTLAKSGV